MAKIVCTVQQICNYLSISDYITQKQRYT